ncbi:MAG TPA: gamma-glutamyltransferase, partial [Candidatus Nitrosotenuis sp.]|nr:gamma-glutamyltransferase [Candidatus Nitrosotenuis sp.]
DRSRWLGDPDFVKVPLGWLTSKAYADRLRADIPRGRARRSSQVAPGQPPDDESPDTTHLSVVDAQGNAVALTYTLNFSYGSHAVAEGTGILLNNEMDDFSAAPGQPNAFGLVGGEYNAIAPGKRPLSSMTPTLVTRQGRLAMVLGSPGGSRIITTVLQVFLNVAEFGRNAQSAVSAPRVHHQWLPDEVFYEEGISPDTLALLQGWGHPLTPSRSFGHAILIVAGPDGTLEGGVDPRRPGTALGL